MSVTVSTTENAVTVTGPTGAPGPAGTNGKTWYRGTSDPSNETGADGDFYLNYTTWHVWEKVSGTWTDRGTIKGADGSGGGADEPSVNSLILAQGQ